MEDTAKIIAMPATRTGNPNTTRCPLRLRVGITKKNTTRSSAQWHNALLPYRRDRTSAQQQASVLHGQWGAPSNGCKPQGLYLRRDTVCISKLSDSSLRSGQEQEEKVRCASISTTCKGSGPPGSAPCLLAHTDTRERERLRDERFPLFLWFLASDADSSLAHFTLPHLSNWQTPIHSSRPSLNIS